MNVSGASSYDDGGFAYVAVHFEDGWTVRLLLKGDSQVEILEPDGAQAMASWSVVGLRLLFCKPPMAPQLFAQYWRAALLQSDHTIAAAKQIFGQLTGSWAEVEKHFLSTAPHLVLLERQ
jgi:hypothetical protein